MAGYSKIEDYSEEELEKILHESYTKSFAKQMVMYTGQQGQYEMDKAIQVGFISEVICGIAPTYKGKLLPTKHSIWGILDKIREALKQMENEV